MIHPNMTAVNYIWGKFQNVWINGLVESTMKEVDTVQKGLLHKPLNPSSEAHKRFMQELKLQEIQLAEKHEHIVFKPFY